MCGGLVGSTISPSTGPIRRRTGSPKTAIGSHLLHPVVFLILEHVGQQSQQCVLLRQETTTNVAAFDVVGTVAVVTGPVAKSYWH